MTFAEKLLLWTTGVGVLHHLDHVLRYDHSGWPFRPEVTEFTFSLAVYPLVAAVFLARGHPWLRVAIAAILFLAPTAAHAFLETPVHQFRTWSSRPDVNLLDVTSAALGVTAVIVTVLLSGLGLWMLKAFLDEARTRPFRSDPGACV